MGLMRDQARYEGLLRDLARHDGLSRDHGRSDGLSRDPTRYDGLSRDLAILVDMNQVNVRFLGKRKSNWGKKIKESLKKKIKFSKKLFHAFFYRNIPKRIPEPRNKELKENNKITNIQRTTKKMKKIRSKHKQGKPPNYVNESEHSTHTHKTNKINFKNQEIPTTTVANGG